MLLDVPEILTWRFGGSRAVEIHEQYLGILCDALGQRIGATVREDKALGERLIESYRTTPDSSLARVLLAPETSYWLLWQREGDIAVAARFLAEALDAESFSGGPRRQTTQSRWTALGDWFCPANSTVPPSVVSQTGPWGTEYAEGVFEAPRLNGNVPVDYRSPHVLKISLSEDLREATQVSVKRDLSAETAGQIFARMQSAASGIRSVSRWVTEFVDSFTQVLALRSDPTYPDSFASSSSGQYVGRTLLVNAGIDGLDELDLADALIHEAIHSLLYMDERREPWITEEQLYFDDSRVISPWSGQQLRVRPFLQACFVWFGLLQFWQIAATSESFDRSRVLSQISTCSRGFESGSLIERLGAHRAQIAGPVLDAIGVMQEFVGVSSANVGA